MVGSGPQPIAWCQWQRSSSDTAAAARDPSLLNPGLARARLTLHCLDHFGLCLSISISLFISIFIGICVLILVSHKVLALFLACAHAESRQRVACHRNPISISIWLLNLRHVAQCLRKLAKIYYKLPESLFGCLATHAKEQTAGQTGQRRPPVQARLGNLSEHRLLQSKRAKS